MRFNADACEVDGNKITVTKSLLQNARRFPPRSAAVVSAAVSCLAKELQSMNRETEEQQNRERLTVTYREAAATLGVCERVVWQLVKDRELKVVRLGRSVRIPVAELRRFVEERAALV